VQVGGGVRSTQDVEKVLNAGAARVVVGTKAIEDWPWFTQLANSAQFTGKLVLALDAKGGMVATRGWTQANQAPAIDFARQVKGWRLAGILYTDIAKDGMLQGPNLDATRLLAKATDVPIIASGGVGKLGDIRSLLALPIWGVIVGRSLHEGRLNLAEAIEISRRAKSANEDHVR
jgi:phosphoribosylformimino-5-aminoimidazole carboxamide ribotide isomerase